MKNTTAGHLVEAFQQDVFPDDISVLADYWGRHMVNDETMYTIYGVYKGLWLMGVTAKQFHTSFMANSLDALIHSQYKTRSSGYYRDFVKDNIVIGRTRLLDECDVEP